MQTDIKPAFRISLFFLLAIPGLLFFPGVSTVLYPQIPDSDYLVFTIMGKGWIEGRIPYMEFFDNKGPLTYIIQMAALSLNIGKWGIWLFELITFLFSFEIIYRIGKTLNLSAKNNIIAIILTAIYYFIFLGGNSVEEWNVALQLLPLLITIRFLQKKRCSIIIGSLISGICFAMVALLRINDNCIICGLVIGLAVYFIRQRQYALLLKCIGSFLCGLLIIFIPFIIYFISKDALTDYIYDNFIFNYHYKFVWVSAPLWKNFIKLLPCTILPFIAYRFDKKNGTHFFITLSFVSLITFLTFITGAGYTTYYLIVVPVAALCFQMSSTFRELPRLLVTMYILIPLIIGFWNVPARAYNSFRYLKSGNDDITKLSFAIDQYIPDNEKDSIYTFGSSSVAGALMNIGKLPVGKFFYLQADIGKVDDYVRNDIETDFRKNNPKWVLSTRTISNTGILLDEIENYRKIPSDSLPSSFPENGFLLYRRKEKPML